MYDYITKEEMDELVEYGVSYEYAFGVTLAAAFGLNHVDHVDDKDSSSSIFHPESVEKYVKNI